MCKTSGWGRIVTDKSVSSDQAQDCVQRLPPKEAGDINVCYESAEVSEAGFSGVRFEISLSTSF